MKHQIVICMGSSCFARGNDENLATIQHYLSENKLEATVHLVGSRCEGKCSSGPILSIDDTVHKQVTPDRVIDVLNVHFSGLIAGADNE